MRVGPFPDPRLKKSTSLAVIYEAPLLAWLLALVPCGQLLRRAVAGHENGGHVLYGSWRDCDLRSGCSEYLESLWSLSSISGAWICLLLLVVLPLILRHPLRALDRDLELELLQPTA